MNSLILLPFLYFLIPYALSDRYCSWCTKGHDGAAHLETFFKNLNLCGSSARNRSNRKRRVTLQKESDKMMTTYDSCSQQMLTCNPRYKYRSFDGSCNNLNNPTWGMANTPYARILPANYRDAVYLPPLASDGRSMPSARLLSTTFFPDLNNQDLQASLATMQWGQLVAHDIASSVSVDESIDCCDNANVGKENACLSIEIPSNDTFYSQFNVTCQSMTRHAVAMGGACNGIRQQINTISHIMDGSQIYGSSADAAKSLREFTGGRLLIKMCNSERTFLPTLGRSTCDGTLDIVYSAGDSRVNQNPQLAILQTLFAREHNRVANHLQQVHSNWDDERLYQESRAIIIAELQHITYNEWLPLLLGSSSMSTHRLFSSYHRNFAYNRSVTPATINSFATCAYRVGHSGIQGSISMCDYYNTCPVMAMYLSDWLEKPGIIEQQGYFDDLLRGLIRQPMQSLDSSYTHQITQQLLHERQPFGTDLISFDIQRGRDHGISPYVDYLEACTGYQHQSFADLSTVIKPEYIPQLERFYSNVRDIDLFIGGNLEILAPEARIGPTFQCIIAEQFYRYKYGDRFWYEVRGQPHSFTNGQLYEIKKVTLSRLICDNSDGIVSISRNSFLQLSERNNLVSCSQLRSINLDRW